jgi:MFS superfamily sulfate permease-like transporter
MTISQSFEGDSDDQLDASGRGSVADSYSVWATPHLDVPAGIVVFLVALPLCLGLAIACGVPPVSGLIAGAVGGLVIPWISRSPLSVSGPAAGLTAIVVVGIHDVNGFSNFLTCTVLAGAMQFCFGFLRIGAAASIVPSSVIKGMLAAIGLLLIATELPIAFGVSEFAAILTDAHPGATVISGVSAVILLTWEQIAPRRVNWLSSTLVVVVVATVLNEWWVQTVPRFALDSAMLVGVPIGGLDGLLSALPTPNWSALTRSDVWGLAGTLAVVGSIESLLSVEAMDMLDPLKRKSDADKELLAQGVGNFVSGMFGGLPVTAVIIRGSANVAAGGRHGLSAVVHGALLVVALLFFAPLLNRIPIGCLSVILMDVGLKLCHPRIAKRQLELGYEQFVPFAATALAIFMTNLLKGVLLGVVVGIAFVLRANVRGSLEVTKHSGRIVIRFLRDGTFLTKPALRAALARIPDGAYVIVDANDHFIDFDITETLTKFKTDSAERGRKIHVELIGIGMPPPPTTFVTEG